MAEWSEDDARQILADSPWAKTVTATVNRSGNQAYPVDSASPN